MEHFSFQWLILAYIFCVTLFLKRWDASNYYSLHTVQMLYDRTFEHFRTDDHSFSCRSSQFWSSHIWSLPRIRSSQSTHRVLHSWKHTGRPPHCLSFDFERARVSISNFQEIMIYCCGNRIPFMELETYPLNYWLFTCRGLRRTP